MLQKMLQNIWRRFALNQIRIAEDHLVKNLNNIFTKYFIKFGAHGIFTNNYKQEK